MVSCSTLRIGSYLFYIEKFITQFKATENRRGYEPPDLEDGTSLNSDSFDATDLSF